MEPTRKEIRCLNCGRSEEQVPLLGLAFKGGTVHICPQCLPVLIHKPQQLVDRLAGIEIRPVSE